MKEFDLNWIERMKEGDEEAFSFFYSLYSSPLYLHLYRMLGDRELASEVLQEVFIIVLKKLDFYEERDGANHFRAWTYRIATNRAIDEIRKIKKNKNNPPERVEQNSPHEIASHQETAALIEEAIQRLPKKQRVFLNLKIKEEMNYKEIADITGSNVNTVKQGIFRARSNLKDMLKKLGAIA